MIEFASVEQYAEAYRGVRSRVRTMIEGADDEQLVATCPATPEWRVRDTLAHVAGVPADVLAGRMDGVASDAWTQQQVDDRRDAEVAAMLDAWDAEGEQLEPLMPAFPIQSLGQMVLDGFTHELDIAHALGVKVDHALPVVSYAFGWVCRVGAELTQQPLLLDTEVGLVPFGEGDNVPRLRATQFEFVRATTGRRSARQVAALETSAPIDPELVLLAPLFALSTVDIVE